MPKQVTRRDFVNGMAIGVGAGFLAPTPLFGQVAPAGISPKTALGPYYPPTLTGMRASHKGSFEVAHALAWQGKKPAQYQALDEHYDLVVVGAGMSGLAGNRSGSILRLSIEKPCYNSYPHQFVSDGFLCHG